MDAKPPLARRNTPLARFQYESPGATSGCLSHRGFLTLSGSGGDRLLRLKVRGEKGQKFGIETSTDLIHWTPQSTNALSDVSFEYAERFEGGIKEKFYRVFPQVPDFAPWEYPDD